MIKHVITLMISLLYLGTSAQELLTPSYSFSHKKTSYVTLADGTEIQGTIKKLDRKKGLIEEVKIKDGAGKKHKLKAKDIKFMYLPPSGLDKIGNAYSSALNVHKWSDAKLNEDFLSQGYVYFEFADVKMKKKSRKLLMQLLNPGFSKLVKIYHDPTAKKTTSLGIGSIKVAGGHAKSYYMAKDGNPAFLIKKKHYKKEFDPLWNSCPEVISEYPDMSWSNLVQHTISYSECKG